MQAAINDGVNNQPAVQFSLSNCFQTVELLRLQFPEVDGNLVTVQKLLR